MPESLTNTLSNIAPEFLTSTSIFIVLRSNFFKCPWIGTYMVLGFSPQEFSHMPNSQTQIAFSKMPNSCHKLQCPIFIYLTNSHKKLANYLYHYVMPNIHQKCWTASTFIIYILPNSYRKWQTTNASITSVGFIKKKGKMPLPLSYVQLSLKMVMLLIICVNHTKNGHANSL